MKTFKQLVEETAEQVTEIMPWDLSEQLEREPDLLILDVREPYEYDAMHIKGSLNVPRGILETACEYDYEETVPELVEARQRDIVVVCRSGNRSIFAARVMEDMGYQKVSSLKTGLRGWNDFEQPLVDNNETLVSLDDADVFFAPRLRPEQQKPKAGQGSR
jgi:rhodanese-related sulfurtransferase